jgi:branched-chain amino acid transport system permease protein
MGAIVDFLSSYSLLQYAIGVSIIMAMSMYVTMRAGVFSFGGNGFMALGAYASALLTIHYDAPFIPSLLAGGIFAALIAVVVGFPLLRLRGIFFGIATVAFGEVVRTFLSNFELTGGALGLSGIETHTTLGHVVGFIALFILLIKALERSKYGSALFSMQQDELVAASCGVNIALLRTLIFVFSAFIAGVGGGLMAHYSNAISPGDFGFGVLVQITTNSVVGGFGALLGPILGAVVMGLLGQALTFTQSAQPLIIGVIVLVIILLLPKGLIGLPGLRRLVKTALPRRSSAQPEAGTLLTNVDIASLRRDDDFTLNVNSLGKRYGGLQAVQDVSFSCSGGEILGVIGPNGAGKTTLLNMLTALDQPTSGSIICGGVDFAKVPQHEVASVGLARTFQNIRLFTTFTVAQNVMMGQYWNEPGDMGRAVLWRDHWETREQENIHQLLRIVGLEDKADLLASQLSYGEQRRVEIARALAARPRILLVDEPTAGMNALETSDIAELLKQIRSQGIGVILVAHDLDLIAEVCDRVVVMNFGTVIAEGTPHEVRKSQLVIDAYIGADIEEEPALAAT